MSPRELKEYKKRLAQSEADRDWDLLMLADLLDDQGGKQDISLTEYKIDISKEE